MKTIKRILGFLLPVALVLFIFSCGSPLSGAGGGSAVITLVASSASPRTVVPAIGVPASYRYTISKGPTTIAPITESSGSIEISVEFGTYDFLVEGFDADGNKTCEGRSLGVTIDSVEFIQSVTLSALFSAGSGSIAVELTWPAIADISRVEASCVAVGMLDSFEELAVDGLSCRYEATKDSGNYLLKFKVTSRGSEVAVAPVAVQVASALESARTVLLESKDLDFSTVACGDGFTVVLRSDGTLWSWGRNDKGQLGDGTFANRIKAVRIGEDDDWVDVKATEAGVYALKSNGELWHWGKNVSMATTTLNVPTLLDVGPWASYSVDSIVLGVKTDGSLWAKGNNTNGQLGQGNTSYSSAFVRIGEGTDWTAAAVGGSHALALNVAGVLYSWGHNYNGQLGIGSATDSWTPARVGSDSDWESIAAGKAHSIAVRKDGTLWAWGGNTSYSQVGDGSDKDQQSPVRIGTDCDWAGVVAGYYSSYGIKDDGAAWAWGNNYGGMLGDGSAAPQDVPVPIDCPAPFRSLSANNGHGAAIGPDGSVYLWGLDSYGQLGDGVAFDVTNGNSYKASLNRVGKDSDWESVGAGNYYEGALKRDGTFYSCGDGADYRLGNGSVSKKSFWAATGSFTTLSLAYNCGLGIDSSGELWSWGGNTYGTIGDGSSIASPVPKRIASGTTWLSIAASRHNSFAIKSDKTLWAWGHNYYGQLGNGSTSSTPVSVPMQVGEDTWASVAVGEQFVLGIKTNGTLWAWGENTVSQLGDGGTKQSTQPIQVGASTGWVSVFAGTASSFAIDNDGHLWAWGSNTKGCLGDGTTVTKTVPTRIGEDDGWAFVSSSSSHTLGLKSDGSLYAWGNNASMQLGDGTTTNYTVPTRIGAETWSSVSAYSGDSAANVSIGVRTDGSLWVWGDNNENRLGLGTMRPECFGLMVY